MRVVARVCLPDDYLELRKVQGPSVGARSLWIVLTAVFSLAAGYDALMLAREAAHGGFGWGTTLGEVREPLPNRTEFVGLFKAQETTTSVPRTLAPSKFEEADRSALGQPKTSLPRVSFVVANFEPQRETSLARRWDATRAEAGGIVEAPRVASGQSIEFVTSKTGSL